MVRYAKTGGGVSMAWYDVLDLTDDEREMLRTRSGFVRAERSVRATRAVKDKESRPGVPGASDVIAKYASECKNPDCKWGGEYDGLIDFHHKNPGDKSFSIGRGHGYNARSVVLELEKCIPLCKMCHRLVHLGKLDVSEIPTIAVKCRDLFLEDIEEG